VDAVASEPSWSEKNMGKKQQNLGGFQELPQTKMFKNVPAGNLEHLRTC
jgi:hypothetical protein